MSPMIDDPPLLTIRRNIERPERSLVEAFAGTPTGFIVDAMAGRGALDRAIKPLPGTPARFVGTALTCLNGPADNLALCAAVSVCAPGDVLVAATDGFSGCSVVGDLLLGIAKNRGAVGFVTDGLLRDITDIQALGFPAFGAGVSPNSPARNGPGTVGLPIVCGGLPVGGRRHRGRRSRRRRHRAARRDRRRAGAARGRARERGQDAEGGAGRAQGAGLHGGDPGLRPRALHRRVRRA